MKNFLFVITLCFSVSSYSQFTIPPEIKKAVAFIYVENDSGKIVPNGTGFYMAVNIDSNNIAPYLITARHVLRKQNGEYYKKMYLRLLRLKDSVLEMYAIDLVYTSKNHRVFLHPDTTVDIAVIEGTPHPADYVMQFLPSDFLITKEEFKSLNINDGDEVFFTGMFTQFLGEKNNFPISRFGRVALITDEKVFWNGNYRNLYLIEATTYWGNSGAPVYFALKSTPKPQPNMIITGTITTVKLAGIMSGFFGDNIIGGLTETKNLRPYQLVNYGISAITPSYYVWDIIYSDELKRRREKY